VSKGGTHTPMSNHRLPSAAPLRLPRVPSFTKILAETRKRSRKTPTTEILARVRSMIKQAEDMCQAADVRVRGCY